MNTGDWKLLDFSSVQVNVGVDLIKEKLMCDSERCQYVCCHQNLPYSNGRGTSN